MLLLLELHCASSCPRRRCSPAACCPTQQPNKAIKKPSPCHPSQLPCLSIAWLTVCVPAAGSFFYNCPTVQPTTTPLHALPTPYPTYPHAHPHTYAPALAPGVVHHVCPLHLPVLEQVLQLLPRGAPGQVVDNHLHAAQHSTRHTAHGRGSKGKGRGGRVQQG